MAGLDLWPRYETKVSLSWRRESRGVQRMELQPRDSSDHSAMTLVSYALRSHRRRRKQKADWIRQDAFHLSRMGEDGDGQLIILMFFQLSFCRIPLFRQTKCGAETRINNEIFFQTIILLVHSCLKNKKQTNNC